MPSRRTLVLLVPIPALAVLLAFGVRLRLFELRDSFCSYYVGARLLIAGNFDASAYDAATFHAAIRRELGEPVEDLATPNPPSFALLAVPVAALPPRTAHAIWVVAGALSLGAALLLLLRHLESTRPLSIPVLAVAALVPFSPESIANVRRGQPYGGLLLVFTLAFLLLLRRGERGAGSLLGAVLGSKVAGLYLLPVFAVRRSWNALFATVAAAAVVVLATIPFGTFSAWRHFLTHLGETASAPATRVTAYQTTWSFLQHLVARETVWNPSPPFDAPTLARPAFVFVAVSALLLLLARARSLSTERAFCAPLVLSVLLAPVAEEYTYILLALPLLVALAAPATNRAARFALLAALVLLAAPYDFRSPSLAAGFRCFLAYPRLFGGWLLFAALLAPPLRREGGPAIVAP